MKNQLFLLATFLLLFGSCAKMEEGPRDDTPSDPQKSKYVLSQTELKEFASSVPAMYASKKGTKAVAAGIDKIVPFGQYMQTLGLLQPATRSVSGQDTVSDKIYVVNYENRQGFAIVTADTRMGGVLAYADEGSMEEMAGCDGFAMYLENVPALAEEFLETSARIDSIFEPYYEDYLESIGTEFRNERRIGLANYFHQGSPWNAYCPMINGVRALAGSGPIALATVMANIGAPASHSFHFDYDNTDVNYFWWKGPPPASDDKIAKLIRQIGYASHHPYVTITSDADNDNLRAIGSGMRQFGMNHDGYRSYHIDIVKADVNRSHPVLVRGVSRTPEAHRACWVAHGHHARYRLMHLTRYHYDIDGTLLGTEDMGNVSQYECMEVLCAFSQIQGGGSVWCVDNVFNSGNYHYNVNVDLLMYTHNI